jgi:hypothetical protein
MEAEGADVDRVRAAFFRRTRKTTAVLYTCFAFAAVAAGIYAVVDDVGRGAAATAVGLTVMVGLFALSPRLAASARIGRILVFVVVPLAVVAGNLVLDRIDPAFVAGALAGLLAGAALGIAYIRRRLAVDDELFRRQIALGFDPDRPLGWLRPKR